MWSFELATIAAAREKVFYLNTLAKLLHAPGLPALGPPFMVRGFCHIPLEAGGLHPGPSVI